jgi:hypothetical protein
VGHLDRVDPGGVQCPGDARDLVGAVLMTHRVHTVAQRHIADVQGARHAGIPLAWMAMCSAVALAAEVMMSRLPA